MKRPLTALLPILKVDLDIGFLLSLAERMGRSPRKHLACPATYQGATRCRWGKTRRPYPESDLRSRILLRRAESLTVCPALARRSDDAHRHLNIRRRLREAADR